MYTILLSLLCGFWHRLSIKDSSHAELMTRSSSRHKILQVYASARRGGYTKAFKHSRVPPDNEIRVIDEVTAGYIVKLSEWTDALDVLYVTWRTSSVCRPL